MFAAAARSTLFSTPLRKAAFGVTAAVTLPAAHPDVRQAYLNGGQQVTRTARATYTLGAIIADYKICKFLHGEDPEAYGEAKKEVHTRCADRLEWLISANRGIYIKAGQHLAAMNHILPREYTDVLKIFQDHAPYRPYKDVEQIFIEDLGHSPDHYFESIDEIPIASASLAQVHRAVTREGREVVVKFQYPALRQSMNNDLNVFALATKVLESSFDGFQFSWVVPEFRKHLMQELDFIAEGKNSERTAENFAQSPSRRMRKYLRIPKVLWQYSTSRILTMEFSPGVKVTDREAIVGLGVKPQVVSEMLLEMYCEQIFEHGFVHGDPHAGNLLVDVDPKTKHPILVLLDHGLYQPLDDSFRLDYGKLWRALILRDEAGMKEYSSRLGAGDHFRLFSILLTSQAYSTSNVGLDRRMTQEDRQKLRQEIRGTRDTFHQIITDVPDQLYLILKANNIVRSVNQELGTRVNRFLYMARAATRALHKQVQKDSPGVRSWMWCCWDRLTFFLRLEVLLALRAVVKFFKYHMGTLQITHSTI